jgi:hypothetical protein
MAIARVLTVRFALVAAAPPGDASVATAGGAPGSGPVPGHWLVGGEAASSPSTHRLKVLEPPHLARREDVRSCSAHHQHFDRFPCRVRTDPQQLELCGYRT